MNRFEGKLFACIPCYSCYKIQWAASSAILTVLKFSNLNINSKSFRWNWNEYRTHYDLDLICYSLSSAIMFQNSGHFKIKKNWDRVCELILIKFCINIRIDKITYVPFKDFIRIYLPVSTNILFQSDGDLKFFNLKV